MGSAISNFFTAKFNSVKESYLSFKSIIKSTMQAFKMIKLLFTAAQKLDASNYRQTKDPEALKEALDMDDMPETYKNIFSSIEPDVMSKIFQVMIEAFSGADKDAEGNAIKPPLNVEAIKKMSHAMKEGENPFEAAFESMKSTERPASFKPEGATEGYQDGEPLASGSSQSASEESNSQTTRQDCGSPTTKENGQKDTRQEGEKQEVESDFIPNTVLGEAIKAGEEFEKSTEKFEKILKDEEKNQQTTSKDSQQNKTNTNRTGTRPVSPMKDALNEVMMKRFGANWKDKVPTFLKDPDAPGDIPDIGFGLDKESNTTLVKNMSKIMKDIL